MARDTNTRGGPGVMPRRAMRQAAPEVTDGVELVQLMKRYGCGTTKLEIGRQCIIDFQAVGRRPTAEDVYEYLSTDGRVFPGVLAKVRQIIQTGEWVPADADAAKRLDIEDMILAGQAITVEYDEFGQEIVPGLPAVEDEFDAAEADRPPKVRPPVAPARVASGVGAFGGDPRVVITPEFRARFPDAARFLSQPAPRPGETLGDDADQRRGDLPPTTPHTPTNSPGLPGSEPIDPDPNAGTPARSPQAPKPTDTPPATPGTSPANREAHGPPVTGNLPVPANPSAVPPPGSPQPEPAGAKPPPAPPPGPQQPKPAPRK